MMYIIIYVDKNGDRRWKKASDIETAEEFGKQNSDNDYDLCVSLYEYNKLKDEIQIMKQKLEKIETLARVSK